MINLLQGIVDRLAELFPDTNIYVNNVEQGLIEPCFLINMVNTEMSKLMSERYQFENFVNVVYLSQCEDAFVFQTIKERLLLGMRNISIDREKDSGIYGYGMSVRTENDNLQLDVNYDYIGKFPILPDPMMATNKIVHYTTEEPYIKDTTKINPGMWKTPPRQSKPLKIYPAMNPRDERYVDKNKGKMWKPKGYKDRYEIEKERYEEEAEDLMRTKEMTIDER